MIENVLIASMTKGQAPLFVVGFIVALMIWKMPGEDVTKLANRLADGVEHGYYIGYIVSVFTTGGWFFHARYQRKTITTEMRRLSSARNERQAKEGTPLESSEQ